MNLKGQQAAKYLSAPDATKAGLLIFGADAMRVALKRQEAILALVGPEGEAEMRLTRLPAADLRRDGAALSDAIRTQGFFPGPRVAFVEEATDGLAPMLANALREWRPGDAVIVVTAGNLTGKSALKKVFDDSGSAVSIGLYDDPPSREEIEAELKRAGLRAISPEAMTDLGVLARALDPGDFRQTLEKIALYHWGIDTPLGSDAVAACAPATIDTEVDDVIHAVAERDQRQVGALMRRLEGQGVAPVTLCIGAMRHFKALHAAATDGGGAANGLLRARVFGPRRDRMLRQLQGWRVPVLEWALGELLETDLTLRSSSRAPTMAVMERALIRLAMAPK
ncbi:DNA polymerase III subunit delta [Pseudorhodobacter turbinis]|uniref:DNA-directed DNA polymerase n=1 Tax=Pseudorhodobacter turbinis TaxID=2500533 RepID=A0A4P8EF23_9RHOB|nr:DNA polymerase III subunit delta [Pseudorhodobacter turbinis]QCO55691.1 DNA polymerase III subunit delta [Pseudorhodobacter turbinis]